MMKKFCFCFLSILLISFSSCKDKDVTDMSFTFNVLFIRPTILYYDVYPQYEGTKYTSFVVASDELNRMGVKGIIDSIQKSITEDKIYTSSRRIKAEKLIPDTRYYLCCYQFDKHNKPIYSLFKQPIKTPMVTPKMLTFDMSANGSTLICTPRNASDSALNTTDYYYWDYATQKDIKQYYLGDPILGFDYMIAYYQEYEIMPYILSIGVASENVTGYYDNLQVNDTLFVMAAYYDINSNSVDIPEIFKAVYNSDSTFDITKQTAVSSTAVQKLNAFKVTEQHPSYIVSDMYVAPVSNHLFNHHSRSFMKRK